MLFKVRLDKYGKEVPQSLGLDAPEGLRDREKIDTHQIGYASTGRGEKELGLPVTPAGLQEEQVTAGQVHKSLPGARYNELDYKKVLSSLKVLYYSN